MCEDGAPDHSRQRKDAAGSFFSCTRFRLRAGARDFHAEHDPVGRFIGAGVLFLIALFMLFGFLRSSVSLLAPSAMAALLLTVVLPAGAGVALVMGHFRARGRLTGRKAQLRQQTLEAEIIGAAERHGGKLTVLEVVRDLAVTPEDAQEALNALHTRDLAEIEMTESGMLVYAFRDVQGLKDKQSSRGILDA